MNYLLGKWYIHKNTNFDEFLKFTKVPWYQRKIAKHSNIDLEINKEDDKNYVKKVNSLFYKNDEKIILDDNYHRNNKVSRKYSIDENENPTITVDVEGSIVNWKEKIYYESPYLVVEYIWNTKYGINFAKQFFLKY